MADSFCDNKDAWIGG